jgi:hypothetical protein
VDDVLTAIERLDGWLERNDCKGYEPFDGLNAKLPSVRCWASSLPPARKAWDFWQLVI